MTSETAEPNKTSSIDNFPQFSPEEMLPEQKLLKKSKQSCMIPGIKTA